MNRGLFAAQLNAISSILTFLELDRNRIWFPQYGEVSASSFRSVSYCGIWKKCLEEDLYDFQLDDGSLLQFRVECFRPFQASYAYYDCPLECDSYRGFVKHEGLDPKDVGDELMTEY